MHELRIESLAGSREGVRILKLTGPFTLGNIFEFQEIVRTDPAPTMIVDLSGVPYMDSAALGAVLGLHVSCQRDHRKYALAGASDRLRSLFKVAGVDGLLVSYPSVSDAEGGLGGNTASA